MLDDLEKFFVRVSSTWWFVPYFICAVLLVSVAGIGWGNRFIMPALTAVSFWPVLLVGIREDGCWRTFGRLCFGYALLAVAVTVIATWWPLNASLSVWGGERYSSDFRVWLSGGSGWMMGVKTFSQGQLLDFLLMAVSSVATAGLGGVIMTGNEISVLAYNTASLYSQSKHPFTTLMMAWTPWGIVKSVSYLLLLMALVEPLKSKIPGFADKEDYRWDFIFYGVAGMFLVLIFKVILGEIWQSALVGAISG